MKKGINLHGAMRSKIHQPGATYGEIISAMADAIRDLGCDFVRMSGTRTDQTTYDPDWDKYGWPRYGREEHPGQDPYNYNVAAMDAAAQAGCKTFFAGLWTSKFNPMNFREEIGNLMALTADRGLSLVVGTDTEDYVPKRWTEDDYSVEDQANYEVELAKLGIPYYRPMMDGIGGSPSREARFEAYLLKTKELHERATKLFEVEGIKMPRPRYEVHVYAPIGFSTLPIQELEGVLVDYLSATLDNTLDGIEKATGIRPEPSDLFLGEYSGKGQSQWPDDHIKVLISTYTRLLNHQKMPSSYQLLGADNDRQGLVNFSRVPQHNDLGQPANRGYMEFKAFKPRF